MHYRYVAIGLICLLLSACGGSAVVREQPLEQEAPESVAEATVDKTEELVPEPPERQIPDDSLYPLLLAEFALRRRDYDTALENYLEQAKRLQDPKVSAHTTHLAQFLQNEAAALDAVSLWIKLEPENVEANDTLAKLLTRKGRTPEAVKHLAVVARAGKTANFAMLANGFDKLDESQQQALLTALDNLALELTENTSLLITQALLAQQMDDRALALTKLESVLLLEPTNLQALVLEAGILHENKADSPMARIEQVLSENPDNQRLRLQYARMLTRIDMTAARKQFEILSANSPKDVDLLYSLALINRETGDQVTARAYLKQMLEIGERKDEAHYYLGRSYEDEKSYKQAIEHYMRVTRGREFLRANRRLAEILIVSEQPRQLTSIFNRQRQLYPDQAERLFALEAELLMAAQYNQLAMEVLDTALTALPNSTALRYTRSMLGEKQDDLMLMESDLRAIIAREPDNATALNALGYTLANRTDRYSEAFELITRALELSPEEPAILDSMGWVSYRLGDYGTALDYLQQAYALFPDPEVAAHLGEVLWVMNRREEALVVWREAAARDANHQVLRETLDRLGVTLDNEDH